MDTTRLAKIVIDIHCRPGILETVLAELIKVLESGNMSSRVDISLVDSIDSFNIN